jgi:hypothetical protein
MALSFKKLWNDYGIGAIIVLLLIAYGVNIFANYLTSKGKHGYEHMSENMNHAYNNRQNKQKNSSQQNSVQPSNPLGEIEDYSGVNGMQTQNPIPTSKQTIQRPDELLPKDTNNKWSQLNPSGKGELENINLLKAGYHIGIDTIGQTLRNANLQIRSEPPNPQLYVGPWNQSTIDPDFMRVPLEISSGNTQ